MKREHFANLLAILVALSILATFWVTSYPGFWSAATGAITGPVFAVLFVRWMKQYQDERFTQIYNLASRNAFVFLLFALPAIGTILAYQSIAIEAIGPVFIVWVLSMVIAYASGFYYYKRY
ncbi:MAG: hypothetical protein ACW99U_13130 [Candidatus Thorarchaeota archaeon]|jgi:hypothetical protein